MPPPRTPEEGYHLTEDLADHAIGYLKDLRAYSPDKPFFCYLRTGRLPRPAPGAAVVHRALPRAGSTRGGTRGASRCSRARWRRGCCPPGTELSERPELGAGVGRRCRADERRLYARMMEVYAGFLTHTDAQVGRLLDFVERMGELDNTIVLVMSDNGASAEGGPQGSFNEQYFFNFVPESLEENLRRIDDLGGPQANNHYPWGWAWAGNTPLKRFKRDTHEGGVSDPLIVHWPARLGTPGETRHQYVHAIDIAPTLLDADRHRAARPHIERRARRPRSTG